MKAVIVRFVESDFALILTAYREQDGSRGLDVLPIVPNTCESLAFFSGPGVFTPQMEHIRPGARTAALDGLVEDFVRDAARYYALLEVTGPDSNIRMLAAHVFSDTVEGFLEQARRQAEQPKHVTLRRLLDGPKKEKVLAALYTVFRLADKHDLFEPTYAEREAAGMERIFAGDRPKWGNL